jgi:DnaK suppressor protein
MTIDLAAAETTLREERAKLIRQLKELGADESGELTGDVEYGDTFADAGAVTAERTEVLGIVDGLKGILDGVDAALLRIERGSYGICDRCLQEIGADRMEFRPTSILCVACKAAG